MMRARVISVLTIIVSSLILINVCGWINIFAAKAEVSGITAGMDSKQSVDILTDVDINGSQQKVLIQSEDVRNPILLYIHGGPGDPAMMYSHLYSDALVKKFILVNWDQRGSGLSWHEGMDTSKISEAQIYEDALTLTKYLMKKYKKDKIYILGHSFGSIIGLRLAYRHPELYHAYIGMGQVLDWDRSVDYTKKWLKSEMTKAGDAKGLKMLEKAAVPSMDMIIQYGGHTHAKVDFDTITKSSPYYFEGYIDIKNKARDIVQQSVSRNGSGDSASLYDISSVKIPVYFFEGRYDHVTACSPELVEEFYKKLKAPSKEIIWFKNSAHLPNLEEPLMFQQMLINKVLKR